MPRNRKSSLIQKIARQADVTFKSNCGSKVLLANITELSALLNRIRVTDLNIKPRAKDGSLSEPQGQQDAPVTYMHICESHGFSMGVFTLRSGASIPLHDHPGMNGMLKVLYGKVRVHCFDKLLERSGVVPTEPELLADSELPPADQKASLHLAALRSSGEFTEQSSPCVLSPRKDNLHQIDALDGSAAFLDILAPPYDPDHGRDCHYYRVLRTNSNAAANTDTGEETAWLLEIPQPEEFWCGSEPYPGPKVSV